MPSTEFTANPDGGSVGGVNPRSSETIKKYNAIAVGIAERRGVLVSDLNAYAKDWGSECYTDTCHYTASAFATLGKEVARRLGAMIEGETV